MPNSMSKLFREITIGGSGVNNPPNYDWNTLANYPGVDPKGIYQRINVIVYMDNLGINLQVTGLAVVMSGVPLIGPTDLCYMPCPPCCS